MSRTFAAFLYFCLPVFLVLTTSCSLSIDEEGAKKIGQKNARSSDGTIVEQVSDAVITLESALGGLGPGAGNIFSNYSITPAQGSAAGGVEITVAPPSAPANLQVAGTTEAGTSALLAVSSVKIGNVDCLIDRVKTDLNTGKITFITAATDPGEYQIIVNALTASDLASSAEVVGNGGKDYVVGTYTAAPPPPTVSSINPSSGSIVGGTSVTISGAGFSAGATVSLGGSACIVGSVTSNTITCTTAAHAAGAVDVQVTNSDAQSGTLPSAFTYVNPAPTVSNVSPISGPVAGGTSITITGTGFRAGASVSVGGSACTGISVTNATSITCTTPAHAAGAVGVTVTNTDDQSATLANAFTFLEPAPTLTSVSPSGGKVTGGDTIILTGTGFINGATIKIGTDICANVVFDSSTQLKCDVPSKPAGSYVVNVTNPDLQATTENVTYTYSLAPIITSVSPNHGPIMGGTEITITGANFSESVSVVVGGTNCETIVRQDASHITCTTASHVAGAVGVTVQNNSDNQTVTVSSAFTYDGPPSIGDTSQPTSPLAGGGTLVISGTGFLSGATITVGGTACGSVTFVRATELSCTLPAKTVGTYDITVTNPDTQSATKTSAIVYQAGPAVTEIDPVFGPANATTNITITGSGFLPGVAVQVGGTDCTPVTLTGSTQIDCPAPSKVAGAYALTITNPDSQTVSLANAFTYRGVPTVTVVSPASGPSSGGTSISITGTNFFEGATVTVGGASCSSVNVQSQTSITCTTPSGTVGAADIVVTVDSQSGTGSSLFTYAAAPILTSISLTNGKLAGGDTITLTGTGFQTGATVNVGASVCTEPNIVSSTQITCKVPLNQPAGAYLVKVTNPDNQFTNQNVNYAYNAFPVFTSVSPDHGPYNATTNVTITGDHFLTGASVTVGGAECTSPSVSSPTTITCIAQSHDGGLVAIVVTNPDTQSATLNNGFLYNAAPAILTVTPNAVPVGEVPIIITGLDFRSNDTVKIGLDDCTDVTFVSSTELHCTVPLKASGSYDVTVSNTDGLYGVKTNGFTYNYPPTISSINPSQGPMVGGTEISITGTHFVSGATAKVGGVSCASTTWVSATSLTCVTPSGASGLPQSITVTNPDGLTVTVTDLFTYVAGPVIESISPNNGKLSEGTTIIVSGSNFTAGATMKIGGTSCISTSVDSSTQITCIAPAKTAGSYPVVVTNPDSQASTQNINYTYNPFPTVSSVNPTSGPIAGNELLTVTGTGFITGASVRVGGSVCTSASVTNSTHVTCLTPAKSAGTYNVDVINPDNQSGTGTGLYTYYTQPTVTIDSSGLGSSPSNNLSSRTITLAGANVTHYKAIARAASDCSGVDFSAASETAIGTTFIFTPVDNSSNIVCAIGRGYENVYQSTPTASSVLVIDTAPPSSVSLIAYDPAGNISSDNTPIFTLSTVEFGWSIQLYDGADANCLSGAAAGSATATGASEDITAIALSEGVHSIRANVTDLAGNSTCSNALSYTVDTVVPAAPSVGEGGWVLLSPADGTGSNDNTPEFTIPAGESGTTARVYTDNGCTNLVGSISISASNSVTMSNIVFTTDGSADGLKTFYGKVVDAAGNASQCTALNQSYTLDTTRPSAPTLSSTSPASNSDDNNPEIIGSAEANSTVKIFTTVNCSGAPLVTSNAATLASPGITMSVLDDTENYFYASATDSVGNVSDCSSVIYYKENSPPPADPTNFIATLLTSSSVTIGWTHNGTNTTGFDLEYCEGVSCDFTTKTALSLAPESRSQLVSALSENTTYNFRIHAKNTTKVSGWLTGQVLTKLNAPTLVSITDAGLTSTTASLTIQWADNSSFETKYEFQHCEGISCNFGNSEDLNVTQKTLPDLPIAGTHSVIVRASDGSNSSDWLMLPNLRPMYPSATLSRAVAPSKAPSDGNAYATIYITPISLYGSIIGAGQTIEVNSSSSNITLAGNGDCSTPSSTCIKAMDAGGGTYTVTAKTSSALAEVSAQFTTIVKAGSVPSPDADVTFTTNRPTILFKTADFRTVSTTQTLTLNSNIFAGDNLYISNGSAIIVTFGSTTEGMSLGDVYVSGSVTVNHTGTTAGNPVRKLDINIASLNMNGGSIDLKGLGYPLGNSYGPTGPSSTLASSLTTYCGASHGGLGAVYNYPTNSQTCVGPTYDDYRNPSLPGAASISGNPGAGVLRLTSSGFCTVDSGATISASNPTTYSGAGGSIYMSCAGFGGTAGTSAITANGGKYNNSSVSAGGGMIALISTGDSSSFTRSFTYPINASTLTGFKDKVKAYGGYWSGQYMAGAGTIFLKHSGLQYGDLIVDNGYNTIYANTLTTYLPSISGKVTAITGNSATVNIERASSSLDPNNLAANSGVQNLWTGMMVSPGLPLTGDPGEDWINDNVRTIATNNGTTLTGTTDFTNLSLDSSFRTIHVFDHIDIANGARLETNGDIYVKSGQIGSADPAHITLTTAFLQQNVATENGTPTIYPPLASLMTLSSGTYTMSSIPFGTTAQDLTLSGATVTVSNGLTVPRNLRVENGTLTTPTLIVNSSNAGSASSTVSGGTLVVNDWTQQAGDILISGGTVKHYPAVTSPSLVVYQLTMNINGTLTMTGGTVNLDSLGYPVGVGFGVLKSTNSCGASHGGLGTIYNTTAQTCVGPTYDDYRDPSLPGAAGVNTRDTGAGRFRLTASGTCTINDPAKISASATTSNGGATQGGGAGGSIYMKCAGFEVTGPGAITADGGKTYYSNGSGGGMIALISTGNSSSFRVPAMYPATAQALSDFKTVVHAYGGRVAGNSRVASAGTIYLKHSGLQYGDLIVDNGNAQINASTLTTYLPSIAGTVDTGTAGGNSITLNIARSSSSLDVNNPALNAGVSNLYKGMMLRPDLSFTNNTSDDWTDDNIIEIVSNSGPANASVITATNNFTVANGTLFRTIHVFDHIDIANGARLETNGDIYVKSGQIGSADQAHIALTNAFLQQNATQSIGTPGIYPPIASSSAITLNSGTYTLPSIQFGQTGQDLTVAGATVTVSNGLTVPGNLTVSTGSLTAPSMGVDGDVTISGGTANITNGLTVSKNLNVSSGSLTASSVTVTQNSTVSGGTLTTNSLSVGMDSTVSAGTLTVNDWSVPTGNVLISGGVVSHYASTLSPLAVYKLTMTVGGFSMTDSGQINLTGRGYPYGYSYGSTGPSALLKSWNSCGGSHGGFGGVKSGQTAPCVGPTYDDYKNPSFPGAGPGTNSGAGGGVLKLLANGTCSLGSNSLIAAIGSSGGAGGTVNMHCNGFQIDGSIYATGSPGLSTYGGGGGGMISLVSTGSAASFLSGYPDHSTIAAFKTKVKAYGGYYAGASGAAGTIYLRHAGLEYGDLIIDNAGSVGTLATRMPHVDDGYISTNDPILLSATDSHTVKISDSTDIPMVRETYGSPGISAFVQNDIFVGYWMHVFPTNSSSFDPSAVDHIIANITSNTANTLTAAGSDFPQNIDRDHYYRFLYKLDHLEIGGNAQVDMSGADLWLTSGCDLHSAAGTFDVPAGSSLTVNTFKHNCTKTGTPVTPAHEFIP